MRKPLICTQCASKFMTPVDLKIHENQDQSEKPFCCTHCASILAIPADLKIKENQN